MQKVIALHKKDLELLEAAKKHAKKHYLKKVTSMAAVLRTKKGNLFTGINVKYKPIWKCICAERVAIAKAIEAGDVDFATIVTVKYFPDDDFYEVVNMCGECRQLAIFHKPLTVISVKNGKIEPVSIEDILPYAYS